jgi:hypothetical protein
MAIGVGPATPKGQQFLFFFYFFYNFLVWVLRVAEPPLAGHGGDFGHPKLKLKKKKKKSSAWPSPMGCLATLFLLLF